MHAHPSLEKAEVYLNLQLSRLHRGLQEPAHPAFITLSRESGAGANSLARLLAAQLNPSVEPPDAPWTVFDGNIVEAMLEAHHYSSTLARFLPEDTVSEVHASVGELVGLHPNLWELTQKTNELMRQLARLGHCILVGRGSTFACAGLPHGTHLRLVGSLARRAQRLAVLDGLSLEEARQHAAKVDAARRRYVDRVFGRDVDDVLAYDAVINTDQVPLEEAAEWVVRLVRRREPVLT